MNILITGASRGIGYELVLEMSKSPDHRIIAISRNKQRLLHLQEKCLEISGNDNVVVFPFDLADFSALETEFVAEIKKHISSIDILINNAGQLVSKVFSSFKESDFDQCFDTNTKAPFFLIKNCLSLLSSKAHIVNIGSMGGVQSSVKFSGLSAYSSSKGALAILTECLAEEYKEKDWSFNCLALGAAQTEMLEEAFPGYKAPMSANEMAIFISDFALNGNRYFNGKILPVALSTP